MDKEELLRCKHARLLAEDQQPAGTRRKFHEITTVSYNNSNFICVKGNCPLKECKPEKA